MKTTYQDETICVCGLSFNVEFSYFKANPKQTDVAPEHDEIEFLSVDYDGHEALDQDKFFDAFEDDFYQAAFRSL